MKNNYKIIKTKDGSNTIIDSNYNETYHSEYGAISESEHIFIKNGLRKFINKAEINILEFGFGTGLNALLTYKFSEENKIKINYITIEKYPINTDLIKEINYNAIFPFTSNAFKLLHNVEWEVPKLISNYFIITKLQNDFLNFKRLKNIDLVYFDAFSPDNQPELWSVAIFKEIFNSLNDNGLLTTYSSKGLVKQNLRKVGFVVKRLKGPLGKRHILNAQKKVSI